MIKYIFLLLFSVTLFGAAHKIAIDPASTGVAYNGIESNDLTLAIGLKTRDLLTADTVDTNGGGEWTVTMLRSDDTNPSLASRIEAANSAGVERLIKISINSVEAVTSNGIETYSRDVATPDKALANLVQDKLVAQFVVLSDRGWKVLSATMNDQYYVTNHANMPVIVTYPGFIRNATDMGAINNTTGHQKAGKAIMYAFQEHYGHSNYDPTGDNTLPVLNITSHTNNQTVTTTPITVMGTVTDNIGISSVTINDVAVTYNSTNNTFQGSVPLIAGNNTITVKATDTSNNISTKSIVVNYDAPDTTKPVITVFTPTFGSTVNVSTIQITGKVTDSESAITVFKIGTTNVALQTDGSFSYSVTLTEGENTFTLYAKDAANNEETVTVKVTYNHDVQNDTTPPVIVISSPANNATVNVADITVSGTITDESQISEFKVNNEPSLLEQGSFSHQITLLEGQNTITVYAKDEYNNSSTKSIIVTYNPQATDTTGPDITISSPAAGARVTTPSLIITGIVTDSSGVSKFSINNTDVTLNASGRFNHTVILTLGENKFTFKATDTNNNNSEKVLFLYLESNTNSGPLLNIMYPQDGTEVKTNVLKIIGSVTDSDGVSYLTINSMNVPINQDGSFEWPLTLSEGPNQIIFEAADIPNNKTTQTLTVTYTKTANKTPSSDGCSYSDSKNYGIMGLFFFMLLLISTLKRQKSK